MISTNKKVVAIGGGTGLSVLLKGLKRYPLGLSAIVTMTDDGMSSGRLRKAFGILPPGDIRQTILALSTREDLVKSLFEYRFKKGKGLSGHSLGNLLILALEHITGSFNNAVNEACKILATLGEVIPSTLENVSLIAEFANGKKIIGERKAYNFGKKNPIQSISLNNPNAKANPEALKSIKNADIILIGPGSLWTSIIPNFLLKEISKCVVKNKKALKIYIANVSTERGETQNYSIDDHVNILIKHSSKKIINCVLVNNKIIKTSKKTHMLGEINNITTSKENIYGYKVINKNLIDSKNPLYHDPEKLANVLWKIFNEKQ